MLGKIPLLIDRNVFQSASNADNNKRTVETSRPGQRVDFLEVAQKPIMASWNSLLLALSIIHLYTLIIMTHSGKLHGTWVL